jgi:nicotinate-nucleotide--dimethylbenzimidazole phosphoribosyltransferase
MNWKDAQARAAGFRVDEDARRRAAEHVRRLTMPTWALGRLLDLAVDLCGIRGRVPPEVGRKVVVVAAADHGVTSQGVSAYPREVTAQMVRNFLAGGAAINVLARRAGARVLVADLGVAADLSDCRDRPGFYDFRIAGGTADFTAGPAMSPSQLEAALDAGAALFGIAEETGGVDVVVPGDMGIGNTTAAAAVTAALTGLPVERVVGPGTGVDEAGLIRKRQAVRAALDRHRPDARDPAGVAAALGGFEIAALAGLMTAAAAARVPIVLDGFIAGAAALAAVGLCPAVRGALIAGHLGAEPGHARQLEALQLSPLLSLSLRLGEGSGAALALPLLDAAVAVLRETATFDSAGVSRA